MTVRLRDTLWNLLYPPRCVFCEEMLGVYSTEALCPACQKRFAVEREYICPICRLPHSRCKCLPPLLARSAKEGLHLAEYGREESVTRTMILYAKAHNERYLFDFLGRLLAEAWKARGDPAGMLVTYVPRSPRGRAKAGLDQAKELAAGMAAALELPCLPLLVRRSTRSLFGGNTVAQKKLSADERKKNVAGAYAIFPAHRPALLGKRILLCDDVITTGATMAACVRLLRLAGAAEVYPVSVGMTYRRRDPGPARPPFAKTYQVPKKRLMR